MKQPRRIKLIILFLLSAIFLCSCTTSFYCKRCPQNATVTTIIQVKDTTQIQALPVVIPKDSSFYWLYLKCKDGKVVIDSAKKDSSKAGKYISKPLILIHNNRIEVSCQNYKDTLSELRNQLIHCKNTIQTVTIKTAPEIITQNSGFAKAAIYWLIASIIAVIVWLVLKFYKV